jgi:hypothetical protein
MHQELKNAQQGAPRARISPKRGDWHQSDMKLAYVSQWVTYLATD